MNIDMAALLKAHSVEYITGRDPHCTPGWINMRCPFCDDHGRHLGWNLRGQYFNCWKCGGHGVDDVLAEILEIAEREVWAVKKRYDMRPGARLVEEPAEIVRPVEVVVPGGPPLIAHLEYLTSRNYDAAYLQRVWSVTFTDHLARGTDKFRVVCPIWHDGRVVSWQGRDITGKSPLRWKSCPKELEARDHKHCLGGQQLVPGDSVAVVEGFTDAWRMGPGAVCTFGTDYLAAQVLLLRAYRRRFVILDSAEKDPNAAAQAERLAAMLSAFPGETVMVELDGGDPGDMAQADADYLMEVEWRVR